MSNTLKCPYESQGCWLSTIYQVSTFKNHYTKHTAHSFTVHICCPSVHPGASLHGVADTLWSLWARKVMQLFLTLSQRIWAFRNDTVHGATTSAAYRTTRHTLVTRINDIYRRPPSLLPKYGKVTDVPLETRLLLSNEHMKRWLLRLEHQVSVSEYERTRQVQSQRRIEDYFAPRTLFDDGG